MPDATLVATVATDLAPDALHLTTPIWVSPCGGFVGYPSTDAIVILAAADLTEVRRVAFPEDDMLRFAPRDGGEEPEGIQCGAVGPGGAIVAFVTHDRVAIGGDGAGWRDLSLLATEDELATGAVTDEDARWLGEPDGVAFDRGGRLWVAGTVAEGRARLTCLDAASAAIVATADLPDEYPDPVYVTLLAAARGVGVSIACGQDGCAVSEVRGDGAAVTVVDAVRFDGAACNLLGWAPDGARVVAGFDFVQRIDADGEDVETNREAAGSPAGAVAGSIVLRRLDADRAALHDAATLAPLAEVAIVGSQLYPLADGVVTLGDGDGDAWGTLRRYLVTP